MKKRLILVALAVVLVAGLYTYTTYRYLQHQHDVATQTVSLKRYTAAVNLIAQHDRISHDRDVADTALVVSLKNKQTGLCNTVLTAKQRAVYASLCQ